MRWGLREPDGGQALARTLRQEGLPLRDDDDLTPLLDAIGDARYVLVGEATHGTSEFYSWRARLTRRLLAEKGFGFVAVEGDWPDCMALDRLVKRYPEGGAREVYDTQRVFKRWPTWMWANHEVADFLEWQREHNWNLPPERKTGFYGIDVYSLWESLDAVSKYLEVNDPDAIPVFERAARCFEPYFGDEQEYARSTLLVPSTCEREVVALLADLRERWLRNHASDDEFEMEQNALVIRNAEAYYRAMVRGGAESWNVRDRHMVETLERLMARHGPDAKCVVWEHNTHVGDARFTDMAGAGMVNVGQLVRESHPDETFIVGFGSYEGSVVAGAYWDAPLQRMPVPSARDGSWEQVFHEAGAEDRLLLMEGLRDDEDALEERGHRAIGVVYDPARERYGNYVPSVLPRRYDAFLHVERSQALHPLHVPFDRHEAPETYPFGE